MDSPFTERLDVLQKRPPILVPQPQPNPWREFQQVREARPCQLDVLAYGGAETAVNLHAKQGALSGAFLGQARPSQNFTAQLRSLQQHYTILDDDRLITEILEEETSLYTLLIEAIKPLQRAFGEKRIIHLRIQSSEDDIIVKVAVQLPADFGADPERALRSFDEEWWLNNCHRSGGALVFDYEMQDAV